MATADATAVDLEIDLEDCGGDVEVVVKPFATMVGTPSEWCAELYNQMFKSPAPFNAETERAWQRSNGAGVAKRLSKSCLIFATLVLLTYFLAISNPLNPLNHIGAQPAAVHILWYGTPPCMFFAMIWIAATASRTDRVGINRSNLVRNLTFLHASLAFLQISLLTFANWKAAYDVITSPLMVDADTADHRRHWGQCMLNELGWLYSGGCILVASVRTGHRTQLKITLTSWLFFLVTAISLLGSEVSPISIAIRFCWLFGCTSMILIAIWHSEDLERKQFENCALLEDRVCLLERAEKEKEQRAELSQRAIKAEGRADAERNLMAFLCHEIRNPVM
jgi:hypothetical protein